MSAAGVTGVAFSLEGDFELLVSVSRVPVDPVARSGLCDLAAARLLFGKEIRKAQ